MVCDEWFDMMYSPKMAILYFVQSVLKLSRTSHSLTLPWMPDPGIISLVRVLNRVAITLGRWLHIRLVKIVVELIEKVCVYFGRSLLFTIMKRSAS